MYNFHVGQKVVCVNADRAKNLKKGSVYSIKAIHKSDEPSVGLTGVLSYYSVQLAEAEPNQRNHIGFCPTRFKPAVTRKTDISIFTNMLRDVHADA